MSPCLSCINSTNSSPPIGATSFACKASSEFSRTPPSLASPLSGSGSSQPVSALYLSTFNRSKGAHHHGNSSPQFHRIPQPPSFAAERIQDQPSPYLR